MTVTEECEKIKTVLSKYYKGVEEVSIVGNTVSVLCSTWNAVHGAEFFFNGQSEERWDIERQLKSDESECLVIATMKEQ